MSKHISSSFTRRIVVVGRRPTQNLLRRHQTQKRFSKQVEMEFGFYLAPQLSGSIVESHNFVFTTPTALKNSEGHSSANVYAHSHTYSHPGLVY